MGGSADTEMKIFKTLEGESSSKGVEPSDS